MKKQDNLTLVKELEKEIREIQFKVRTLIKNKEENSSELDKHYETIYTLTMKAHSLKVSGR
jgi:chaperonin cofactor prefoldin